MKYRLLGIILGILGALVAQGATWETMFAYNAVNKIAVTSDKVYAISDGALFSVNKQSEQIEIYNSNNGLHGSNIGSLYYDNDADVLIIGYTDGKIDLLINGAVDYVSGLYTKDMTATKTINNITVHEGRAYLAMDFGIVTFNLKKHELVDTYYIGAEASEVKVKDVLFAGDSIYAFGESLLYKACLADNIVDYRFWTTEPLGRIQQDPNKGILVKEANGEIWEAGGEEGIVRHTQTNEKLTYKPDGPLLNIPYHMDVANGRLYVVPGGRWASQNKTPGCVMIYDGTSWLNIPQQTIQAAVGGTSTLDFMDVAVDPLDAEHFFVTAYGGGVYEFRNYQAVQQYLPANSTLVSATSSPTTYTRCSSGVCDETGNFWCCNMSDDALHCLSPSGQWNKISLVFEGTLLSAITTTCLILDNQNPHLKWIPFARYNTGLILLDDNGTLAESDDKVMFRNTWTNESGKTLTPAYIYAAKQDVKGNVWLGTSSGVLIIPTEEINYFDSDLCKQLDIVEDNGENPFQTLDIRAIEFDDKGQAWIGTGTVGVYVVSSDGKSIVAHYTPDNSPMPSGYIMSLVFEPHSKKVYIGTSGGIVAYTDASSGSGSDTDEPEYEEIDYGSMQQWKLHYSYTNMQTVVQSSTQVYGLAEGALFSVNKQDETLTEWNRSTGLNGSNVSHIAYDKKTRQLIICYSDSRIDLLSEDREVVAMLDLYHKASTLSVTINNMFVDDGKAYLAMPFGIVAINMTKAEVEDTFYIGERAQDVDVQFVTILGDSIYAVSETDLYVACTNDNLVDYNYWDKRGLPSNTQPIQQLCSSHGMLYILQKNKLYCQETDRKWSCVQDSLEWLSGDATHLFAYKTGLGVIQIDAHNTYSVVSDWGASDAIRDASDNAYWLAVPYYGLCRWQDGVQLYMPDGPLSNYGYRLKYDNDQLFAAPGGRWASQYNRVGDMSVYDGQTWHGVSAWNTYTQCGSYPIDIVSCAAAKDNPGHFYAACYGRGVYEFKDYKAVHLYDARNSTLSSAVEEYPELYTRTEGAMVDDEGNLWVLNTGENAYPIHILTPQGQWKGLDMYVNGRRTTLTTPWEITTDQRDSRYKWIIDQRDAKVCLLYDGGTPTEGSDDRCMSRNTFYDQDELQLTPSNVMCLAQDNDGDIWIGTSAGIIIIPSSVDFFTSDKCYRVKIPRNDGTNLADYLLGTEQVNCIAVDGANRKWIGTENSGLYLMSEDGLTTEAHFTTENSLLPSNTILSVAIDPKTGEVFAGTGSGIASYRSDASDAQEDFSNAYAFPNPVRPNYEGMITISGLMENTTVNIVDAGGNLVCKTRSNGGVAVWDGKNQQGERASSGVYTALCNAGDGKSHTVVKILVMH